MSGKVIRDIEILAEDSLFVFVEVTIDPTGSNNPLVIEDHIIFNVNGNSQKVALVAWGQDVHLINGQIICNETWSNDKPYLVYNSMLVDSSCMLNIEAGTKIHFHKNSRLFVNGTIRAIGSSGNEITFLHDRLEAFYDDIAGQWTGIYLLPGSRDNIFQNTIIKNAIIGIQADTVFSNIPTVQILESEIKNMSIAGLFGQGAEIYAQNTVFSNCGEYLTALTIGGKYTFTHCTFANFWSGGVRNTPAVLLNNYYEDIDGNIQVRNLEANFNNCIIDGNNVNEIFIDNEFNTNFVYSLNNTSVKSELTNLSGNNIFLNPEINYAERSEGNFRLQNGSFPKEKGNQIFVVGSLNNDKDGALRSNTTPSIGAYE